MWKLPRRMFTGSDATDVDDFNETYYEYGSESGRLTEHNCQDDILGTVDADRIANYARDASGVTHASETDYYAPGAFPLESGAGWTTIQTVNITTRDGVLRCTGYASLHGTLSFGYLAIRVDGVLVYESQAVILEQPNPAFAQVRVPDGRHVVELVIKQTDSTGISVGRTTLTVIGTEK